MGGVGAVHRSDRRPRRAVRAGTSAADPLAQCIESSSTCGGRTGHAGPDRRHAGRPPGVDPASYGPTPPAWSRCTGGKGETPFRPAPDLPNLGQRLIATDSAGALIDDAARSRT